MFVHYPEQLIRNLDKPKYSAHKTKFLRNIEPNGNIRGLEFKISQVQTLRKRHDSNTPCNKEIDSYDMYLLKELSKDLNCVPSYWIDILRGHHELEECTSSKKLQLAYGNISDVKNILSWNQIPCDEMLLLSIDSINEKPDPVPKDIVIKFYYAEPIYEEIKYTKAIGFVNWLSNVGGFLGIFLGVSMMQFPELFPYLFQMCKIDKQKLKGNHNRFL